jgi:molybdopterin-guanine dinucleotide biosynthesis protein A
MTAEILRDLLAGCNSHTGTVPRIGEHLEPLSAIFPKTAHRAAAEMLSAGAYTMNEFVRRCLAEGMIEICDYPNSYSHFFVNWNCPSDMASNTLPAGLGGET